MKKMLLGAGVLCVLVLAGVFFWARAILATDAVRSALAGQIAAAIGQPVTIDGIGASIYPRVTVDLTGVSIGDAAQIRVRSLHIGTALGALLSRRVEHGTLRLDGARIELPLLALALGTDPESAAESSGGSPLEIVSIDEVQLTNVEIVSGGRTLRGDIMAVPRDAGVLLTSVTLGADDATFEATGEIRDFNGPVGELSITSNAIDTDQLLAFLTDFSAGVGSPSASAPASSSRTASPMLAISIEADRATSGQLAIDALSGRATVTGEGINVDPLSFGVFGGRYEGSLALSLTGDQPAFTWNARLSRIDMDAALRFAGFPDVLTGQMSGEIELSGLGANAASAMSTARGTARIEVTDGIVKNLGLVRSVVIVTSGRSDAPSTTGDSRDEPFSSLGATLAIATGAARTQDLHFESENLNLVAAGSLQLDGSAIHLAGKIRLSEALSEQAGRDLQRYT
jgi:uncharacterized protein involved in outer membrane biogenesis